MTISTLFDERVQCLSVMTEIEAGKYLDIVESAYENRGGLAHQRDALKTASGRRIRERMVKDIIGGAVLPPLVIGLVSKRNDPKKYLSSDGKQVLSIFDDNRNDLSIIDGMQRTTALVEALDKDPSVSKKLIRIEMWLARQVESLVYRMLILNSGQIPWNLKQQLRVVYEPLVDELYEKVDFSRLLTKPERRYQGGEFSADDLIETYIAFGLRRTEVDTQENLAEEFSKLDITESLSENRYDEIFFPIVQMMVDVDRAFSRFGEQTDAEQRMAPTDRRRQYDKGKNIFDTQPPRIGFIVANAVEIVGRIGMDRDPSIARQSLARLKSANRKFVLRLNDMSVEELRDFLALDVLQEALSTRPSSAVGRWERAFWESAFRALLQENYDVPNMIPCWRAG